MRVATNRIDPYTTIGIYVLSLIPVVVVLVTGYKPSNEMRDMLEKTPELKFLQEYGSYLAADKDDWNFVIFQAIWLSSAFAIVALCIIVAVAIIIQLHKKRQFMSSKSLALHRSLTIHLTVQILIPVATTLIPMVILFCTRYMKVPFGADCNLELGHFADGRSTQSTEYHRYYTGYTTLSQSIRQAIQAHFEYASGNKIEFCYERASRKKQHVHLTTDKHMETNFRKTTLE
ncbi:hypothetical protein ANCDUO_13882 [Ancylostoma duodenale]|uniref:Uncharacterized protein n=1 Tax=Ancylostoma duodenale TaxID=51022 RepID=A0A0C2D1Q3_9BILA|nr:hypothetical protein ANCDUO_13882 [Ancylostoma duodenale]